MPASARAQVLFRGFSFVAPSIEGEDGANKAEGAPSVQASNGKSNGETERDYTGTALLTNRVIIYALSQYY